MIILTINLIVFKILAGKLPVVIIFKIIAVVYIVIKISFKSTLDLTIILYYICTGNLNSSTKELFLVNGLTY